jgi:cytochrome c1
MLKHALAAAALSALLVAPDLARAAEEALPLPHQEWSFYGIFGTYDRASLQRGFQVYKEVCSVCHAVKHLYFRDLADLGYSEDEVKAIAAGYQVTDPSQTIRARCTNGRVGPPTLFPGRSRMIRQHAMQTTAPFRLINR